MDNRRSLLLLGQGDPRHPDTWSGIPAQLIRAFESTAGISVNAVDVDSHGVPELLSKVMSFTPSRQRWAARHHYGAFGVRLRSRRARAAMAQYPGPTLQFGAQFLGVDAASDHLYCYCDANVRFGARSPFAKRSDFLNEREKAAMIEREQRVYSSARKIFVFSNALRDSFIDDFGISPDKVVTVFAGVNLDLPAVSELKSGALHDGPPTILFVGREFERKGGPDLVRAFRDVRAQIPDARLEIAGCRPDISEPGVDIIGPIARTTEGRARLAELYRSADVFCMPSLYEPFGIVFAEAMVFGLPCVGTAQNAMPDVIDEGKTGWLVPPGDVNALGHALTNGLRDRERLYEMGLVGRQRALEHFTWPRVAEIMTAHMFANGR
jgi:alpha-maltose-1-phosphate synthase